MAQFSTTMNHGFYIRANGCQFYQIYLDAERIMVATLSIPIQISSADQIDTFHLKDRELSRVGSLICSVLDVGSYKSRLLNYSTAL